MKNIRVAHRYAAALMAFAEESGRIEETSRDCALVDSTLRGSRALRLLTTSPVVSSLKKAAVFKELFERRVDPHTMTFIDLVIRKQRESHLGEIIKQFEILHDLKLGIVIVDVTTAVEFTPSQEKDLRLRMEHYTDKKVRLRLALDPGVKGGLIVRIGDRVLDASIRRQMEILKARLVEPGPFSN